MRSRLRGRPGPPGGVEVDALADVLRLHRIGPSLDHLLRTAPDAGAVAHLRAATRPATLAQAARQLPVQLDLRTVARALDGLPWAVLKGPAVAATVHGGAPREFHDLDVLVSPAAFGDALRALEAVGARAMDPDWAGIRAARAGEIAVALPHGTFLDLHWHLVNRPARRQRFTLEVDTLLDRARQVELLGTRVPTLDPVDQLHHLALHACLSGAWRLLWSYDLRLAAGLTDDAGWSELVERTRSAATSLPVAMTLARARQTLDAPVPGPVLRSLAGPSPWLAAQTVVTATRPPERLAGARRNGAILFTSTGRTTAASAAEFARASLARGSRRPAAAAPDPTTGDDRAGYLDYVADQTGAAGAAGPAGRVQAAAE
ncbi:nucleotidyltransferase family protein [Kineococcus sp. SYSU DK003]|uniref:nucleotidyltransferase family protein n=1 Tax=Kineococcus sp. SYSU DK003 TaxID=3383124 RepID=UPI003D7C5976